MDRKTSTFRSIGISAALVAGAIWFLSNHHYDMWATGPWQMPHGMMTGGGMGFLFRPEARAAAQDNLLELMTATKRDLQTGLPFAMDPVIYVRPPPNRLPLNLRSP